MFKAHRLCVTLNSRLESKKGPEAGSYVRLIDLYHLTPGLRAIVKNRKVFEANCVANISGPLIVHGSKRFLGAQTKFN